MGAMLLHPASGIRHPVHKRRGQGLLPKKRPPRKAGEGIQASLW